MSDAYYSAREAAASANEAAFGQLLCSFPGIQLKPADASLWRCTKRKHGSLSGLDSLGELEILCTDGVIAWFSQCANPTYVFPGHLCTFLWTSGGGSGNPGPLFSASTSVAGRGRAKGKTPKAKTISLLEQAMRLLME